MRKRSWEEIYPNWPWSVAYWGGLALGFTFGTLITLSIVGYLHAI